MASGIDRIGGTSVPGLAAKPLIDILVAATSLAQAEARIRALRDVGHDCVSKNASALPMSRHFVNARTVCAPTSTQ